MKPSQEFDIGDCVYVHYKTPFIGYVEEVIKNIYTSAHATEPTIYYTYVVKKTHGPDLIENGGYKSDYGGAYLTKIDNQFIRTLNEIRLSAIKLPLEALMQKKRK